MVSIILVNWNGKKWLKKCLDSLYSQTYKNFEIILVDNASTDDSVFFVKLNYPHIRIIQNDKNYGFAKGNDLGIKNAEGDHILLLNNDAWIEDSFLEKMVEFYQSHNYDIVGPKEVKYDGEEIVSYSGGIDLFGHPVGHSINDSENQMRLFYLSGVCLFFRKELYFDTGGLDEDFFMYCEEVDWFWRLNLLKKKFYQNNDLILFHAGAGSLGNGIKYAIFLWRNQNTLQMLLKNYAWYNLIWVIPIYILQNIVEIIFFIVIFKPKIALSYIQGWWFNVANFRRTLKKRKKIQDVRIVGDKEIFERMYKGFGKILHLFNRYHDYNT